MKYEDPNMQIIVFETEGVIRTSLVEEDSGSGIDKDGEQPWN